MTVNSSELKTGFSGPSNGPNCGVSAVATITETPFPVVFEFIRHRFKKTEGWKGSTYEYERRAALEHFGATVSVQAQSGKERFWQWALKRAKPDTTYMIDVTGHSFVYRNGLLVDQVYSKPTPFAWCGNVGNRKVDRVWEITSLPSQEEKASERARQTESLTETF
jgi:hypothetical protein